MIKFKKGDTYDFSGGPLKIMAADGTIVTDFTGWTATSKIRGADGSELGALTFEWLDEATGMLRVYAAGSTAGWATGKAKTDIEFVSPAGVIVSTYTTVLYIVEDVTYV